MPNAPRHTQDLITLAERTHSRAVKRGDPEEIADTQQLLIDLKDYDDTVETVVTALRRTLGAPSVRRQFAEYEERQRWAKLGGGESSRMRLT